LISSASSSSDGIYGVGSGAAYAIGAIHAGAKPMKAMEIAAKLTAFTSGPYITKIQYSK
jgi:ATP-dependent protease HslVU (ClpYQ) peptidase subunit